MLDPSSSKLGASNGAAGGFDPDQFNTMQFNFFNPNQMSGGGGGGSGGSSGGSSGSSPKFDPNSVNKIQSNMLDPSTSKLGASGGAAGGFDPDQFNTMSFNFFNPQAQVGKRGNEISVSKLTDMERPCKPI